MGSTLRFPADLKAEADAYASALGISFNALCAVAVRDYLDARSPGRAEDVDRRVATRPALVTGIEAPAAGEKAATGGRLAAPSPRSPAAVVSISHMQDVVTAEMAKAQAAGVAFERARSRASVPKVGANQPCSCGSGKKYKHCHGKP